MSRARDPAAVEHALARLDGDELAGLVADLWAARGFETRRSGGVVVATRGGSTTRLAVRGAGTEPPDGPVDVVVDTGGRAIATRGGASATRGDRTESGPRGAGSANPWTEGARLVDATALREMLWYAVDVETAAALCERHLGAPPDRLTPPVWIRLRRRLGMPDAPWLATRDVTPDVSVPGPSLALLAVLLVVVGAGAVAGTALVDDGRARGGGTPTPGSTPAAVPADAPRPVFPGLASVPGVNATGVTDPAALSAAHGRALGDRYAVWIDVYRPAGEDPDGPMRQLDIDVSVAGDRYFLESARERDRGNRPVRSVYDDGDSLYVTDYRNGTVVRRALPPNASSPATVPEPDVLRRTLVDRYLTTPETNVSGVVEEDGREYYRIVGTGPPDGDLGNVSDYRVVALVDERGLVADLTVRYARSTPDGRAPVRFEVAYGSPRDETFRPPAWYEVVADNRTGETGGH